MRDVLSFNCRGRIKLQRREDFKIIDNVQQFPVETNRISAIRLFNFEFEKTGWSPIYSLFLS